MGVGMCLWRCPHGSFLYVEPIRASCQYEYLAMIYKYMAKPNLNFSRLKTDWA